MTRYEVIGVAGIGEVRPGDDIAQLIVEAAARQATPVLSGDLLVIGQKIVSKAEGRLVKLADVQPSPIALAMAPGLAKDPRLVEVILAESRRVVRMDKGVLITETHHGWICANAGIDQSNVDADSVALLPEDSDRSARAVRDRVRALLGVEVFVIVTDTFGRPWREGLTNVAIGIAGFAPLLSYLGERDPAAARCKPPSWRSPTSSPARRSRSWASSTAFRPRSCAGSRSGRARKARNHSCASRRAISFAER
jgi:coenzyme F420-0:L-glutamate ligase/coenzyme F420-1:gamma-L-glutamate ligase